MHQCNPSLTLCTTPVVLQPPSLHIAITPTSTPAHRVQPIKPKTIEGGMINPALRPVPYFDIICYNLTQSMWAKPQKEKSRWWWPLGVGRALNISLLLYVGFGALECLGGHVHSKRVLSGQLWAVSGLVEQGTCCLIQDDAYPLHRLIQEQSD